jgi:hypothetical protein
MSSIQRPYAVSFMLNAVLFIIMQNAVNQSVVMLNVLAPK